MPGDGDEAILVIRLELLPLERLGQGAPDENMEPTCRRGELRPRGTLRHHPRRPRVEGLAHEHPVEVETDDPRFRGQDDPDAGERAEGGVRIAMPALEQRIRLHRVGEGAPVAGPVGEARRRDPRSGTGL